LNLKIIYKREFKAVPIIKSAIKRMHQAAKRRARNMTTKRDLKAAIKAFIADPTSANLSKAQANLDKAVKKNVLEKNTASRRKAKLAGIAKAANTKAEAPKKAAPKAAAAKPAAKAAAKPKATAAKSAAKKPAAKKPAAKKAE
jgi:ribosomal protein S20